MGIDGRLSSWLVAIALASSGAAAEQVGWRLVPPAHDDGGRTALPVTFPDGTDAELTYPRALALAQRGVVPYSSGRVGASGRDFEIARGDLDAYLALLNGGSRPPLIASHTRADGRSVGLWDLPHGPNYLGFQLGRWAVLVYDYASGGARMTEAERVAWSEGLDGRETAAGFLTLTSSGRLRLARRGEHAGPRLEFGSLDATWVSAALERCAVPRGEQRVVAGRRVSWVPGSRYARWCLADSVSVAVRGRARFIRAVIRGLAVRHIRAGDSRDRKPVPTIVGCHESSPE